MQGGAAMQGGATVGGDAGWRGVPISAIGVQVFKWDVVSALSRTM
jgi:hypothetical protein